MYWRRIRQAAISKSSRQSHPVRRLLAGCAGFVVLSAFGCHPAHRQSALHPASGEAGEIAALWWFMFSMLAAVFILVILLTAAAVWRRPENAQNTPPGGHTGFVVLGGIVMPAVILVAMLFYSLHVTLAMRQNSEQLIVEVIGHQWWWEVRYPDLGIVTANEIYLPAGETIRIELTSSDVVHSFWVPNLQGKRDAIPEVVTTLQIHPDAPGSWRGQCAEFCGRQHALMAFEVVALPREEFDQWAAARYRPHPVSEMPELAAGEEVFFEAACDTCHTIRGTAANGEIGPDLTHIGSRLTLGAGTIPNNHGTLAGWILNPQAIKPGNEMPRTYLDSGELQELIDYLKELQ